MDDENSFWVELADLVETRVDELCEDADSGDQIVTSSDLADIGAPMVWCSALIAVAARADRSEFLLICGQLFDKAQIAYSTGQPMGVLLNPDVERGQA